MCASPSAVTRLACGEIGRSGNSSAASSSSLTNALLMQSSSLRSTAVIIWEVHGDMGTLKAVGDAPHRQRFSAELFRQEKVHSYWAPVPAAVRRRPPAAGNRRPSGGCDAPSYDAPSYDAS